MAKEKQRICPICNKKLTLLKSTLKDGIKVCAKHVVTEAGLFLKETIEQSTVEDIRERIELLKVTKEELQIEADNFTTTKVIGTAIQFDDKNKKVLIPNLYGRDTIYNYKDVVSYELLEDDEVVTSGGLGRAAIGGMLFGGAGAVVGAVTGRKNKGVCNSLGIKLTLNNMSQPVVYIPFILTKTKTDSDAYKAAASQVQECLSVLQLICNQQEAPASNSRNDNVAGSAADEIKKFKELLDDGILTQEEFDAKKKELLGI